MSSYGTAPHRGLALSLLLSGCVGLAVPADVAELRLDDEVVWSPVAMDQVGAASLLIQNTGNAQVAVSLEVSGDGFALADGALSGTIAVAADQQAAVALRFTPIDGAPREGALVLTPDPSKVFASDAGPRRVTLSAAVDPDADDDGHGHLAAGGDDCDDRDPTVSPDQAEIWYDGTDQDCDGRDDDQDEDGAPLASDCDDTDPDAWPGADDASFDGVDSDCDGLVDEDAVAALVGAVVITEVYVRDRALADRHSQWLEFTTAADLPEGLLLQTEAGTAEVSGLGPVEAGRRVVLCADTDPETNGGIRCDGTASSWPALALGADSPALIFPITSDAGVEVDRATLDTVAWSADWGLQIDLSWQLDPDLGDATLNDAAASWCLGAPSSPGAENLDCP